MVVNHTKKQNIPKILAPAGNKSSFLAALAAGADAIYCGLKTLSARMEAKNFSLEELASLTGLAHKQGTQVHVTLNTQLKTGELEPAGRLLSQINQYVKPDALIIQDPGVMALIRQLGFKGAVHLSTLAGGHTVQSLELIRRELGIDQIVLPRELNIDEIKLVAAECPDGLGLEVFIHGALCYGVSGRCYWSSYLGGRSSLRGRCVQPCRRQFSQAGNRQRFFSNQDLSVDVLAKVLKGIPQVKTWKIEGRKKGPHYVYYTVSAYRMLRDEGSDPKIKKAALALLERSLGRRGTHFHFLPQRPQNPIDLNQPTGSGMLLGRIKGSRQALFFTPKEPLLRGDRLRIGYEDQAGHTVVRVGRAVPAGGKFVVKTVAGRGLRKGAPVFLTDRREPALVKMIEDLEAQTAKNSGAGISGAAFKVNLKDYRRRSGKSFQVTVRRSVSSKTSSGVAGFWLQPGRLLRIQRRQVSKAWWWLPPVVWPSEEADMIRSVEHILQLGARQFVLNSPWQIAFFDKPARLTFWAGPFCNLANALSLEHVAGLGFSGAIISPEIGKEDFLSLPRYSPIPLGIVSSGNWPLTISRYVADEMKLNRPFTSARGEQAWVSQYGGNYWVFPNWEIDLTPHLERLINAGYKMFVHLDEPVPGPVKMKKRPGLWNWKGQLK
jgi:putative protease